MDNAVYTNIFLASIEDVEMLTSDPESRVTFKSENITFFLENQIIDIKVGDNKVKVSTLEFMKAFKDMLDEGVFSLDQIDSEVWSTENELEKAREQRDFAYETLREIRGGF